MSAFPQESERVLSVAQSHEIINMIEGALISINHQRELSADQLRELEISKNEIQNLNLKVAEDIGLRLSCLAEWGCLNAEIQVRVEKLSRYFENDRATFLLDIPGWVMPPNLYKEALEKYAFMDDHPLSKSFETRRSLGILFNYVKARFDERVKNMKHEK